jgi:tRNA1(Val) A37 N6-methylase TrmN6
VFNTPLIESLAHSNNLQITTQAQVIAVEGKKPYVTLLEIKRYGNRREALPVIIQSKSGDFTEQYRQLTKEFYLKF